MRGIRMPKMKIIPSERGMAHDKSVCLSHLSFKEGQICAIT